MTHARRRFAALLVLAATSTVGLTAGLSHVLDCAVESSRDASTRIAGIEGEEIPLPRTQLSGLRAHG